MSVQHFWNLYQLLGPFTRRKHVNLSWNFVTVTYKQRPESTRCRLCCENLGTSYNIEGFAIGSFLERTVVERSNNQRKTDRFLAKFTLKIITKSAVFLPIAFRPSLPPKFPRNSREIGRFFHDFVPTNPVKFDFFPAIYQKSCISNI